VIGVFFSSLEEREERCGEVLKSRGEEGKGR
jgi:hypothetical protein